MLRRAPLMVLLLGSVSVFNACGSNPAVSNEGQPFENGGSGGRSGNDAGTSAKGGDGELIVGSAGSDDGVSDTLTVKAETKTVTVNLGEAVPKVAIDAFLGDVPVKVAWSVDRGDLASVTPGAGSKTSLVPTGSAGGEVTVTAVVGDWSGQPAYATIVVPPLATVWLRKR